MSYLDYVMQLLTGAGFFGLATYVVKQWFAAGIQKDVERYKSELGTFADNAKQQLQHELNIIAHEHQVKLSDLHGKRVEAVETTYVLLRDAEWAAQSLVQVFEPASDKSPDEVKREKFMASETAFIELQRYFEKKRIFLPEAICLSVDKCVMDMRRQAREYGVYTALNSNTMTNDSWKRRFDAWQTAAAHFEKNVPEALRQLERELRGLIEPPKA